MLIDDVQQLKTEAYVFKKSVAALLESSMVLTLRH